MATKKKTALGSKHTNVTVHGVRSAKEVQAMSDKFMRNSIGKTAGEMYRDASVPVVAQCANFGKGERKHSHYYKNVRNLSEIDVYRVLKLFNVTDPCLQHSIKKLLVAGGRGAGKDIRQDIQESIDALKRWQEMDLEDVTPA